jgi:hypothetical protein
VTPVALNGSQNLSGSAGTKTKDIKTARRFRPMLLGDIPTKTTMEVERGRNRSEKR